MIYKILFFWILTLTPSFAAGRIKRSQKARRQFMIMTGFRKGRPGYIIDHVIPLRCGGPDVPSNMQWQTAAEAKAKDKTERNCESAIKGTQPKF